MSENDRRWLPTFQDPNAVSVYVHDQALLVSVACLLYYDHLLTIKNEIRFVWRSPRTLGTAFFLLIRYGFLLDITLVLFYTVQVAPDFGPLMTERRCRILYDMATIIQVVSFAAVSAFVALRVAALWSHSWSLGCFLFVVGLFNPSTTIPLLSFEYKLFPAPWPMFACVQVLTFRQSALALLSDTYFPIGSSAVSIAYELLCLALTVIKTMGAYRQQRKFGIRTTLSGLLLRDGSLYFLVLAALGILNVVAGSLPESPLPDDINVVLGRVFVPILTTRFIMNLRQTGGAHPSQSSHGAGGDTGTLMIGFSPRIVVSEGQDFDSGVARNRLGRAPPAEA